MPRIRWTPEEEERLVDLIAAGKSWTSISGILKRSMKSIELHAKTHRLVGAKRTRAKGNENSEIAGDGKNGAALHVNALKLPSGPDRDELLQDTRNFVGK